VAVTDTRPQCRAGLGRFTASSCRTALALQSWHFCGLAGNGDVWVSGRAAGDACGVSRVA
jgi:hypothetical protein